jgi:4-hydroxy-tetrahydrodipicolinate synthase
VPWPLELIGRLLAAFGPRLAGLKDSSGDMNYARAAAGLSESFRVFPSTEAALIEAHGGRFAGCISATVNVNSDLCACAYRHGDSQALAQAVAIRGLFDGKPVVAGVKAVLAHIHREPGWARVLPPLTSLSAADRAAVIDGYERVRAASRAA